MGVFHVFLIIQMVPNRATNQYCEGIFIKKHQRRFTFFLCSFLFTMQGLLSRQHLLVQTQQWEQ